MDIRYDLYEDKAESMTLDYESSTLDPPNAMDTIQTAPVIDCDEEIKEIEKHLEDYCEAKIYHNHPDEESRKSP